MERLKPSERHDSMRGWFAYELRKHMAEDNRIWLLTGDLGYGMLDKVREDFPDRFLNCGAAEQAMMGIACGLALEGKKPFVYTISSFFMRAAETINIYLHHEQIPVKMVGSGVFDNYKHDGYSHNATMIQDLLGRLKIEMFYPQDKEQVPEMLEQMLQNQKPSFIGLIR